MKVYLVFSEIISTRFIKAFKTKEHAEKFVQDSMSTRMVGENFTIKETELIGDE